MIRRLQHCLDKQAAALELRDPAIKQVRQEIDDALANLEQTVAQHARDLSRRVETLNAQYAVHNARNAELTTKIAAVGKELKELESSELQQEISSTATELDEIDKQMEILMQRRQELATAMNKKAALFNTRKNRFTTLLSTLEGKKVEFDTEGHSAAIGEHAQYTKELIATTEGRAMWKQTCSVLDQLDRKLTLNSNNMDLVLQELETASSVLFTNLQVAKEKNLGPIILAIGHEHTVLQQAIEAVRSI